MPEITSIEPQKKKKGRFNIFVDGAFAFGLDAETVVKAGLKVGQEIRKDEIQKLVFENETNKLTEKALKFLSFRPRSARELRTHLRKKFRISPARFESRSESGGDLEFGILPDEIISSVLDHLKHLGYVDDLEFTKWWVDQRQKHRQPRGRRLIRSELYKKGVAREIIDEALPDDQEGEVKRALKAAQKKLSSYDLKSWKSKRKMSQYLARRGFDWGIIKQTLNILQDYNKEDKGN